MPSCSKSPSQNLFRNPEFFLLGISWWAFFQSCLECPFPKGPRLGSNTHSAPKGVYYLMRAGSRVPSCPMRQPFRVCSCLRAQASLWQWGKPRALPATVLVPHAPAEGRDTACTHCSSMGHLHPPHVSDVEFFSGRQGREKACPGIEGQSRLSIKTIVSVSAFLHRALTVPHQEKSEARKMGQGTSLTEPLRIWMYSLSVFYQGHFQNFLTYR